MQKLLILYSGAFLFVLKSYILTFYVKYVNIIQLLFNNNFKQEVVLSYKHYSYLGIISLIISFILLTVMKICTEISDTADLVIGSIAVCIFLFTGIMFIFAGIIARVIKEQIGDKVEIIKPIQEKE